MGLDRSEAVLPTDGHHHARVHLLVDEPLSEAAAKVVRRRLSRVLLVGLTNCPLGDAMDDSTCSGLCKVDERVFRSGVPGVLILLEVAFYIRREVCVSRFSAAAGRVLPSVDVRVVLSAVGLFNVCWPNPRYLERSKANARAELDDVVAVVVGNAAEVLDVAVSRSHFAFVTVDGFDPRE